jgi:hypothetical protein
MTARSVRTPADFSGRAPSPVRSRLCAQRSWRVQVVARLEAFITGYGLDEAYKRADAYHQAGADAILCHSKKSDDSVSGVTGGSGSGHSSIVLVHPCIAELHPCRSGPRRISPHSWRHGATDAPWSSSLRNVGLEHSPPSPLPPSCEMAQPLAHAQPSASSAKVTAGPASWP